MNKREEMFEFYTDNFYYKFLNARDYHYKNIPVHKRNSLFRSEFKEVFGYDLTDTMKSWSRKTPGRFPDAPLLKNICDLLDCDMEYFLSDQKVYKKSIGDMEERIGLDYESIDRLSKYPEEVKELLNIVIHKNHMEDNSGLKSMDFLLYLFKGMVEFSTIVHRTNYFAKDVLTSKTKEIHFTDGILRENPKACFEKVLNCVDDEFFKIHLHLKEEKIKELEKELKEKE